MHCSYKLHISCQKWGTTDQDFAAFSIGSGIPKSALPALFPPSQPSPRGGALMLSPLWKKLFDFSHC